MNLPPRNVCERYQTLPNDLSLESFCQLEKVGIIEPLEYNKKYNLEPFKSRL